VKDVGNTASKALRGILKAQLEAFVRYAEKKHSERVLRRMLETQCKGFVRNVENTRGNAGNSTRVLRGHGKLGKDGNKAAVLGMLFSAEIRYRAGTCQRHIGYVPYVYSIVPHKRRRRAGSLCVPIFSTVILFPLFRPCFSQWKASHRNKRHTGTSGTDGRIPRRTFGAQVCAHFSLSGSLRLFHFLPFT
jgi:hypothetical protein